jgi:two-component system alkaline phosphatase synthesis response regulator PhoP
MLRQNLAQWGHLVAVWEPGESADAQAAAPGDILLVDLDGLEDWAGQTQWEEWGRPPHWDARPAGAAWPPARLTVALGSQMPRRRHLEALGAVLFLPKPFDMSVLRGYLTTLEHILSGERLPAPSRSAEGQPLRVLVADDDSRVTEVVCETLATNRRYVARAAHDGIEVLEQCLIWQPHCLVIDMMMPRMNGYQVLRCLRAGPPSVQVPVVVVSALAGVEVRAEELAQPMVAVLEKPIRPAQVLAAVERALMSEVH